VVIGPSSTFIPLVGLRPDLAVPGPACRRAEQGEVHAGALRWRRANCSLRAASGIAQLFVEHAFRIGSRRWAPLGVKRLCCFVTKCLLTTWLLVESMKAFEIASPALEPR
jgi:hypothetical protein